MEYSELANELIDYVTLLWQSPAQKDANFFSCGERYLMRYLAEKKSAQPSEISAVMGTSTARTARLLCVLEMKGFIHRRPDIADLRRTIVTPTKSGIKYIDSEINKVQQTIEQLLTELGEEDAQSCVRILKRITEIQFD